MRDAATLSIEFKLSIPEAVRIAHDWKAGQTFAFVPKGEGVLIVPVPSIDDLAGLAHGMEPGNFRDRADRL